MRKIPQMRKTVFILYQIVLFYRLIFLYFDTFIYIFIFFILGSFSFYFLTQFTYNFNYNNVLILKTQMNDLRLLYQYDKDRKIINLQYKQINNLQPLIPILSKFENLQSLSLNGNRLKVLPSMEMFPNLAQIDLSSNLFSDYKDALKGLKSLPNLRHLIYTFKNQDQQEELKQQLPNLQRINKKPLNTRIMVNKKVKKNHLKLQQKDLQQIGQVYDDIRQIYKKSKYMVDKQLMSDFDKSVDIIMADLSSHLGNAKSSTQADSSIITCRYGLIDMCFTKVITYFYHFDKSIAMVLQKIHDYLAQLFKAMGDITKAQQQKVTTQITKVKLKKQELYKSQIKRLKRKDQTSVKQIDYLQKKNNQLIRLLTEYGKSNMVDKLVMQGVMRNYHGQKSPGKDSALRERSFIGDNNASLSDHKHNRSPRNRQSRVSPNKGQISPKRQNITKAQEFDFRKSSKTLTLNQLKQTINDIYACKAKQNKVCQQSGVCLQTMQEYMYTYLNQKYGLKSLTIEWAMGIVSGIKKYNSKQPEIAVFGKVLRNQVEQSFHLQLKKLKTLFANQIKKFKSTSTTPQAGISFNQSEQIMLNCRYTRDTIDIIMPKLRQQFFATGKIPQDRLQNAVMDHFIRIHEQELRYFLDIFKKSDRDQNGIVDRKQLLQIVDNCGKEVDTQMLFEYIDPFFTQKLTFSWIYEMFSKDQSYKQILKQPPPKNN